MTKYLTITVDGKAKLPLDTVVQRKLIVAKNRVGKSNTACAYVEETLDHGVQVVIFDPKGDWGGIRSSGDGEGPGYKVWKLGGHDGDEPLTVDSGEYLGSYFATHNVDAILDISDMTKSKMRKFCADFLESFYETKKKPENRDHVILLVFEEADEIFPQRIEPYMGPDAPRCVGSGEMIAKRAGFLGVGMLTVTQRWASLSKNITTQTDVMIVMRITSPQDMKAGDDWFKEQDPEKREEVKKNIQSLKVGEGFVWAPDLGIFQRVMFRRRKTYDSGYTPKVGETRKEPKIVSRVDLQKVGEEIRQFIEEKKADDPARLKARIRELETANRKLEATPKLVEKTVTVEVPVPVYDASHVNALRSLERQLKEVRDSAASITTKAADGIGALIGTIESIEKATSGKPAPAFNLARLSPSQPDNTPYHARVQAVQRSISSAPNLQTPSQNEPQQVAAMTTSSPGSRGLSSLDPPAVSEGLTPYQQEILDALAWLETVNYPHPTRELAAFAARKSHASSTFEKYVGSLGSQGLITVGQGRLKLTKDGKAKANKQSPPTVEALQAACYDRVTPYQAAILRNLVKAYPDSLSREALASKTVVGGKPVSHTSSTFEKYLGQLSTLGLIQYPEPGLVAAAPFLFLET